MCDDYLYPEKNPTIHDAFITPYPLFISENCDIYCKPISVLNIIPLYSKKNILLKKYLFFSFPFSFYGNIPKIAQENPRKWKNHIFINNIRNNNKHIIWMFNYPNNIYIYMSVCFRFGQLTRDVHMVEKTP
jgi:hypothetical protein